MAYDVGTAVLHVVPSFRGIEDELKNFANKLGKQLSAAVGDQLTDTVKDSTDKLAKEAGKAVASTVTDGVTKGVKDAGEKASKAAKQAGDELGQDVSGAFERQIKAGLVKALYGIPKLELDVELKADQKALQDLRSQLSKLATDNPDFLHSEQGLGRLRELRAEFNRLVRDAPTRQVRKDADVAVRAIEEIFEGLTTSFERAVADAARERQRIVDAAHAEALRAEEGLIRERARLLDTARAEILRRDQRLAAERQRIVDAAHAEALRAEEAFLKDLLRQAQQDQREFQRMVQERVKAAQRAAQEQARAAERIFDKTWAGRVRKNLVSAFEQIPQIEITTDSSTAQRQIAGIRDQLRRLASQRIGIDVDAGQALQIIGALRAELVRLAGSRATVEVRAAAVQAASELFAIKALVDDIDGRRINIHARADTADARRSLDDLLGAFAVNMGRLGALIATVSSVGTAAIPIAAAAASTIGFIGTAAAAAGIGVGTLVLGFSGIGDAVKALDKYHKDAAQSAASLSRAQAGVANAADQIRSAERALANTRASNAYSARRAAQAVEDAERGVARAQEEARQATLDLIRAREQERRANQDLALDLEGLAIAQRQAALDQAEAKAELDRILSNPRATEAQREQARIAYDEITLRIKELSLQQERLTADQQRAAKVGIEGSERVQQARQRERAAVETVAESERRLAAAIEAQREQQRQAAYALQQAQQGVISAQRSMQQALERTGTAGGEALDNLREAMEGLSPAGRRFARFLFGLKDEFRALRSAASEALLPGVQSSIERLLPYLPDFSRFLTRVAGALGWMFDEASRLLTTDPTWRRFFGYIGKNTVPFLERLFSIGEKVARGLAGLFLAFTPFNDDIGGGLEGLATRFAEWATTLDKNEGFQKFLTYVRENGPKVVEMIKQLAIFAGRFIVAAAPIGVAVVTGFTKLLELVNKIPIDVLTILIGVISGVATVIGILGAATAVAAAGTAALVTIGIGALIAAVTVLYLKVTPFREFMQAQMRLIGEAFQWLYENVAKPVFDAISRLITEVVAPAMSWFYGHVIRPIWERIQIAFNIGVAAIKVAFGLFQIAVKLAGLAWRAFYDTAILPVWRLIRPIFVWLGGLIDKEVKPKWDSGIKALGKIWDGLVEATKKPVRFMVDTVINGGILGIYNKIAKRFNVKPDNVRVDLPPGFATGGAVRGAGTSVSDSILARLSNGEHVWTAEEVQAAGGHQEVERLRKAVLGVPGFRRGGGVGDGIGDLFKAARKRAGDAISGVTDFFTDPFGTLKKLAEKLFREIPGQGSLPVNLLVGMGRKTVDVLGDKVKGLFVGGEDGGPRGGRGNSLGGSAGMMRLLQVRFPGLRLISGYRPGSVTLSGNRSYHADDRAVDVAPREDVAKWINRTWGRTTRELITPFQQWNLHNGRPHRYTGSVWRQHNFAGGNAHTHWAYDSGGMLPPGISTVVNATGRPEPVLTAPQWDVLERAALSGHAERRAIENHFHFLKADLDEGRLQAINAKQDALARAGRPH